MHAEHQVLPELPVLAGTGRGILVTLDRAGLHRRGAAADRALDVVLDHEIERAWAGTDDRLPAFDRLVDRARHQGQLLQLIAAIGHLRGQRVILASVREAFAVERLEQDLDLLLEEFAVGVLVEQRRAESLDLAGVITAPDAEHRATL